jgi:arginine/lysine/ornithine decarboxylase
MSIYNFLEKFDEISFHMPGHKGKLPLNLKDITEIEGSDNFHNPNGIILESEKEMAKALCKKHAFFLTNGASSGIIASILSLSKENETVLIDRNCHISVINALILSGAIPRYIYPTINRSFDIPNPVSENDFIYKNEKLAVITSPTYYGDISNMPAIKDKIKNSILLQDEAHGAHFYFSDMLKIKNVSDLSVLGFHKTMPTLNQGAILAINNENIDEKEIKKYINILTTTSPSYPIMASLDYSRIVGNDIYNNKNIEDEIENLKEEIVLKTPLKIHENYDFYKILINFSNTNLNAKEANKILIEKYKIYSEAVFSNNILFMLSPYNTKKELQTLKKALLNLNLKPLDYSNEKSFYEFYKLETVLSPKEAFHAMGKIIETKNAVGRISKENIVDFPPCIPIVAIGEKITSDIIKMIKKPCIEVVY